MRDGPVLSRAVHEAASHRGGGREGDRVDERAEPLRERACQGLAGGGDLVVGRHVALQHGRGGALPVLVHEAAHPVGEAVALDSKRDGRALALQLLRQLYAGAQPGLGPFAGLGRPGCLRPRPLGGAASAGAAGGQCVSVAREPSAAPLRLTVATAQPIDRWLTMPNTAAVLPERAMPPRNVETAELQLTEQSPCQSTPLSQP